MDTDSKRWECIAWDGNNSMRHWGVVDWKYKKDAEISLRTMEKHWFAAKIWDRKNKKFIT